MESTLIAVDTAKLVFEVAEAGVAGKVSHRLRLSRPQFTQYIVTREKSQFVMEACGGAHYWARLMRDAGHAVRLLPVPYVRAYRRRNKTDRADCLAILEAARNPEILPVPVKRLDAQAIQGLHRIRSQWMATRTARINTLRGLLREFGVILPVGAVAAMKLIPEAIDDEAVPLRLRAGLHELFVEVRDLEKRVIEIERQLQHLSDEVPAVDHLRSISGIGLMTATALYASAGDPKNFRSGRHLASWLGLTPREHSSGNVRILGGISKRGDRYVRTLLVHGARSVLARAKQMAAAGQPLSRLQTWAAQLEQRIGHNKAACALANKLARIAWATWMHGTVFDVNHALAVKSA